MLMLMKACSFTMLSYCHNEMINMYFSDVYICIIYNLKDKITNTILLYYVRTFLKTKFSSTGVRLHKIYDFLLFVLLYWHSYQQFSLVTLNEDK